MIKIIAWNVNSIRSLIIKVDLNNFLKTHDPHIFCMSETKLSCPDLLIQQQLMKKIHLINIDIIILILLEKVIVVQLFGLKNQKIYY